MSIINNFPGGNPAVDISEAVVTLEANENYVYDGFVHIRHVASVVLDGVTLTPETDYHVACPSQALPGTYLLSVCGVGEYTGVVQVEWTISKAPIEVTPSIANINMRELNESHFVMFKLKCDEQLTHTASASYNADNLSVNMSSISSVGMQTITVGISALNDNGGTVIVSIPESAKYLSASMQVNVSVEPLEIVGIEIFSDRSTIRLDPDSDPFGYVNITPTITDENGNVYSNPVPAVGSGFGISPYDNVYPWSEMDEYNVVNGEIKYRRGDAGFDRAINDTVVYIPKFYYKIVERDGAVCIYVSSRRNIRNNVTFDVHPGSGVYVGKYHTSIDTEYRNMHVSRSKPAGSTRLVNAVGADRAYFRDAAKVKGTKWSQFGFAQLCAIQILFMVEFCSLDSQGAIGRGPAHKVSYVNTGNIFFPSYSPIETDGYVRCGASDDMVYHTGRGDAPSSYGTHAPMARADVNSSGEVTNYYACVTPEGLAPIQYRHIENLWGSYPVFIDGITVVGRRVYVCADPNMFRDHACSNGINDIDATKYIDTGIDMNYPQDGSGNDAPQDVTWLAIPDTGDTIEDMYGSEYAVLGWAFIPCGSPIAEGDARPACMVNVKTGGYSGPYDIMITKDSTITDPMRDTCVSMGHCVASRRTNNSQYENSIGLFALHMNCPTYAPDMNARYSHGEVVSRTFGCEFGSRLVFKP